MTPINRTSETLPRGRKPLLLVIDCGEVTLAGVPSPLHLLLSKSGCLPSYCFYTPPHFSGGVSCFARWPSVCLSVRPCVRSPYVRPSALPFRSITSIYEQISFKFCICICIKNVSLWIVDGQISIIHHRVMVLVNGQEWFLASSSIYYLEYHDETSQK